MSDGSGASAPTDRGNPGEVTVLTTGGTIDKIYTVAGELETGPPAVQELLDRGRPGLPVTIESVMAMDSLDMTDADRERLLDRVRGLQDTRVVVTHGTDTMTDTADYLRQHASAIADKTVVLTGAIQPAAMRGSDASFNLGATLIAVQTLPPGVYVCMNGRVFDAGAVTKDRSTGRFVALGTQVPD